MSSLPFCFLVFEAVSVVWGHIEFVWSNNSAGRFFFMRSRVVISTMKVGFDMSSLRHLVLIAVIFGKVSLLDFSFLFKLTSFGEVMGFESCAVPWF